LPASVPPPASPPPHKINRGSLPGFSKAKLKLTASAAFRQCPALAYTGFGAVSPLWRRHALNHLFVQFLRLFGSLMRSTDDTRFTHWHRVKMFHALWLRGWPCNAADGEPSGHCPPIRHHHDLRPARTGSRTIMLHQFGCLGGVLCAGPDALAAAARDAEL